MKSIKIVILVFVSLLILGFAFGKFHSFDFGAKKQQKGLEIKVILNAQLQKILEPLTFTLEPLEKSSEFFCNDGVYVEEFLSCGKEIGLSIEGQPIYVFKVGEGSKKVLFVGGLHTGTEKNTFDLAKSVLKYYNDNPEFVPKNISLYIIPVLNPDGLVKNIHNNAKGVDLNRNWPTENWQSETYHPTYGVKKGAGGESPLSEPETESLYNFIINLHPDMVFVWHSQAGTVESNNIGIADELADIYAQSVGYKHIKEWTYYVVTGDFLTAMHDINVAAAEVEIASREQEFDKNIEGVKRVLDYFE